MEVLRVRARPVRVVEVDGVFGEDGDEGEERDRQRPGDVLLRGLGGPREEERGGDDRGAEEDELDDGGDLDAGDAHDDGGRGDEQAEADAADECRGHVDSFNVPQPGRTSDATSGRRSRSPRVAHLSR